MPTKASDPSDPFSPFPRVHPPTENRVLDKSFLVSLGASHTTDDLYLIDPSSLGVDLLQEGPLLRPFKVDVLLSKAKSNRDGRDRRRDPSTRDLLPPVLKAGLSPIGRNKSVALNDRQFLHHVSPNRTALSRVHLLGRVRVRLLLRKCRQICRDIP